MKKSIAVFFFVSLFAMTAFANNPVTENAVTLRENAIKNLVVGLESNNTGLKVSSAYLLGEFKAEDAVIPLLNVFNTDSNEKTRVAAALSLLKIGDERGLRAIRYASEKDANEYVRTLCSKFFAYHTANN